MIPYSFEVFYSATVMQVLTLTMQAIGDREIVHEATQDAYTDVLLHWADRQPRSLQENAHHVLDLAVRKATALSCRQGPSAAVPAARVSTDRPNRFGPPWFDIRDGLRELESRVAAPAARSETLSSAFVFDSDPLWRKAIAAQLVQMGTDTVYEAATVTQARAYARSIDPCDLAILDLKWPDSTGIDLLVELRSLDWPRIVMLALSDDPRALRSAFQAGAQAYLLKSGLPIVMTDGVRQAPEGNVHTDPGVAPILGLVTQITKPDDPPYVLSDREIDVLQLVADGHSNREIAEILHLSALTVKSHMSRIARKLGAGDRAQMVALVMRAGIIR